MSRTNGGSIGVDNLSTRSSAKGIWSLREQAASRAGERWPIRPIIATGGTITQTEEDGITYNVHTFTSSGTFTVTDGAQEVEYVVVAGGGSGGGRHGGGGGAGGYRTGTFLVTVQAYSVVVGDGAAAPLEAALGNDGDDSSVFGITSTGGGGGATGGPGTNGRDGGSGGGSGYQSTGGSGNVPAVTPSQGNDGGGGAGLSGAGGGGAGDAGGPTPSGDGGIGVQSPISGSLTYYAGGGGGGGYLTAGSGDGGLGGGPGDFTSTTKESGTAHSSLKSMTTAYTK